MKKITEKEALKLIGSVEDFYTYYIHLTKDGWIVRTERGIYLCETKEQVARLLY